MHKLDIGTVETFAENVNINQYLNVAMTEVFYKLFPYFCRRLAVYGRGRYSFMSVIVGNVPRVADADGIHYAFLSAGILLYAVMQPFYAWAFVKHGVHFLHLEITVRTTFLQALYQLLGFAALAYRHIVESCKPSLPDKVCNAV